MDINSLYIDELTEYCNEKGWPKFRAKQIYEWLHKKHVASADDMSNIPKAIREELNQDMTHVKESGYDSCEVCNPSERYRGWHQKVSVRDGRWTDAGDCLYAVSSW